MTDNKNKSGPEKIKCKDCHKEIPKSVAKTSEGVDYVYYFCGEKCYDHWKQNNNEK